MRSHSFQDTELNLYRYVNGSPRQVVDGLAILRYPVVLRNREVNHSKKTLIVDMRSHSFQDTELNLYRYVNHGSPRQVVDGLAILRYPVGLRNGGLITQKTLNRHAFIQFLRYRVENFTCTSTTHRNRS